MRPRRDLNLWLLYAAFLVIGINGAVPMVFGPFFIMAHDPSGGISVGLMLALPALFAFVGQNLWGGVLDHWGRYTPLLVAAFLLQGLCFGLLTLASSPAGFIAVLCATAFFSVAVLPAAQAYATIAYEDAKGLVLGRLFAFESVGWGVGCLAGLMFGEAAPDLVVLDRLFLAALAASLTMGILLWMGFRAVHAPPPTTGGLAALAALVRDSVRLYRDRRIAGLSVVIFFVTVSNVIFFAFYSVYLCDHLSGSKALLGGSLAAATVLGAISFPAYGWLSDRVGRGPLIVAATVAYVPLYFAFIFVSDPWLLALLYALPVYPAVRVATNAFLADLTDGAMRGGGIGLIEGVQAMATFVAALAGGLVVLRFGLPQIPMAAFASMVLTLAVVVWVRRAQALL